MCVWALLFACTVNKAGVVKKRWQRNQAIAREAKNKVLPSAMEESPVLSGVLNEVRTFFEGEEGRS